MVNGIMFIIYLFLAKSILRRNEKMARLKEIVDEVKRVEVFIIRYLPFKKPL